MSNVCNILKGTPTSQVGQIPTHCSHYEVERLGCEHTTPSFDRSDGDTDKFVPGLGTGHARMERIGSSLGEIMGELPI
jgi:hypothetical protein